MGIVLSELEVKVVKSVKDEVVEVGESGLSFFFFLEFSFNTPTVSPPSSSVSEESAATRRLSQSTTSSRPSVLLDGSVPILLSK